MKQIWHWLINKTKLESKEEDIFFDTYENTHLPPTKQSVKTDNIQTDVEFEKIRKNL